MSRCLLHIKKLPAFIEWLDSKRIAHRPGRGEYEVLQVWMRGKIWCCVFSRLEMPEHYTVDRRLEPVVREFIKSTKGVKK